MKLNWKFLGSEEVQNKNLLHGREYGYFLELHIELNCYARQNGNNKNSLGPGSLVENRA